MRLRPVRPAALLTAALLTAALCLAAIVTTSARAQTLPLTGDAQARPAPISPLSQPTLSPGVLQLLELEGRFEQDVARGGGKAFASWFADDAVTLNDGKPAVRGRLAIAAAAVWDAKSYQLSWVPAGAQMGPSGDTGFTWGHYTAHGTDANGQPFTFEGRYITFWKKVGADWKVALDASARDAPAGGDCCTLPAPGASPAATHP